MRVNAWTGLQTLLGLGPQIKNSVDQNPDGLLLHENFIMSLIPLHLGMRQYWRDFDALVNSCDLLPPEIPEADRASQTCEPISPLRFLRS